MYGCGSGYAGTCHVETSDGGLISYYGRCGVFRRKQGGGLGVRAWTFLCVRSSSELSRECDVRPIKPNSNLKTLSRFAQTMDVLTEVWCCSGAFF